MDIQTFTEKFKQELETQAGLQNGHVEEITSYKNNTKEPAFQVRFETQSLGLVLYPSRYFDAYLQGESVSNIVSGILSEGRSHTDFNPEDLKKAYTPEQLRTAIVSYEPNREWLKNIPHERVADLALYAKWHISENHTANITNELLSHLKLTKEELLQTAMENTRKAAIFRGLEEIMFSMAVGNGMEEEQARSMFQTEHEPVIVLSVKEGIDGAALAADPKLMKEICREMGEEFYILPSSVHEVLLVKKADCPMGISDLSDMVRSINESEVRPEDRLSDQVYQFDGHHLVLAHDREIKQDIHIGDTLTKHHSR